MSLAAGTRADLLALPSRPGVLSERRVQQFCPPPCRQSSLMGGYGGCKVRYFCSSSECGEFGGDLARTRTRIRCVPTRGVTNFERCRYGSRTTLKA